MLNKILIFLIFAIVILIPYISGLEALIYILYFHCYLTFFLGLMALFLALINNEYQETMIDTWAWSWTAMGIMLFVLSILKLF